MKVSCFGRKFFSVLLATALVLSVFAVFVPHVKFAYATDLFSTGFETEDCATHDFCEWTGTVGSPEVVDDPVIEGSYSMMVNLTDSNIETPTFCYYTGSLDSYTTVYAEWTVNIDSTILTGGYTRYVVLGGFTDASSNPLGLIYLRDNDGAEGNSFIQIKFMNGSDSEYYPDVQHGIATITYNEDHTIQVKRVEHGSNGAYEVWFDGESVCELTGIDTDNYTHDRFVAGSTGGWYNPDSEALFYLDSVQVKDVWIGDATPTILYSATNGTRIGNTTCFIGGFEAPLDLAYACVEHNMTGPASNSSFVSLSGTSDIALINETVSASEGEFIQYRWFVNSTGGDWLTSDYYNDTASVASPSDLYTEGAKIRLTSDDSEIKLYGQNYNLMMGGTLDNAVCYWEGKGDSQYASQWNLTKFEENADAMKVWGMNTIRVVMDVRQWLNNDTFRDFFVSMTEKLDDRGMYLMITPYRIDSRETSIDAPIPPYSGTYGPDTIPDADAYYDFLVNMTKTLDDYGNLIVDIWNEAHTISKSDWHGNVTEAIGKIRTVSDCPVVYQHGYANYDTNPATWIETYEISGVITNVVYSTHQYYNHLHSQTEWTESEVEANLMESGIYNVTQEWNKPLIIGEFAPNLYYEGENLDHEIEAFTHFAEFMEEWNVSYIQWVWRSVGGLEYYMLDYNEAFVPAPSIGGRIIVNAINQEPFVWTVGNGTLSGAQYIYSNNTEWSSSFSDNELTVSYVPDCEVRVWWNVSETSYPLNSTLQCANSNGTLVDAMDYYNSTTNLIELYSNVGSEWTIGYDVEGEYNYTLTIGSATGGSCNLTVGEHSYVDGTTVYVKAIPNTGYSRGNWTLDGAENITTEVFEITMNENHILTPSFDWYSEWGGGGSVTWGGWWGYWWVVGGLFVAVAMYLRKRGIKNEHVARIVTIIIEDGILRIIPIWTLNRWIPLYIIYPLSVILDVIAHRLSNKNEQLQKRIKAALLYNLAWYLVYYAVSTLTRNPYIGFIAGITVHLLIDYTINWMKNRK